MTTRIYTSREAAKSAALEDSNADKRMIAVSFRSPSRFAACYIASTAWDDMGEKTDAAYKPLLAAVLDNAAKSIFSRRIENMSIFPTEFDESILSADAILSEAVSGNSEWMTKEELTQAWMTSATRKNLVGNPKYEDASNRAYRTAVNAFSDLILKLAGKTSTYQPAELDKMLAKIADEDLDTEMGAFIVRRITALQAKPAKGTIDLDIL